MARQLIKPGDTDRLINAKVTENLIEIGLLPTRHSERPDFVRSPRGAAEILDELLAGVSGPKFVGAARNFRSFARDANARFAAAQAAFGTFAISDFKNGVFSINGVAKTRADLWADPVDGNSSFVADVGWEIDLGGGASASDTMYCSNELFAAVPAGPACSGVFVINPSNTADYCQLDFNDADNNNIQFGLRGGHAIRIFSSGGANIVSPTPIVPGPIKIGFTITPTKLALCVNGGVVVGGAPDIDIAQITNCNLYGAIYSARGQTLSVPSVEFRPPVSDTQLRVLST